MTLEFSDPEPQSCPLTYFYSSCFSLSHIIRGLNTSSLQRQKKYFLYGLRGVFHVRMKILR